MTDDLSGFGDRGAGDGDLIEIDLNFESMRRFQAEFSPNLSADGLFIDTGEPLAPGAVVRFRVILPEGFVLLEGTAVVEWNRLADAIADGPPGMALRFVTLSPQNQELVEQLVQDHLEAGGTPFNLDVRPAATDFPTDALEGAPGGGADGLDEGYRLTIRRAGLGDEAEALRALAAAVPGGFAQPPGADPGEERFDAEPHGFEVLTEPRWPAAEPAAAVVEAPADLDWIDDAPLAEPAVAPIGDPPELDWIDTESAAAADRALEVAPPAEKASAASEWAPAGILWEASEAAAADVATASASGRADFGLLPTPMEFDDGPEVITEVAGGELGSPAFDISLPEPDDGLDTTPVLPDEGRGDVTVPDDDGRGHERRRRWWPWAVAALFLAALAGGLLWPEIRDRLGRRTTAVSATDAATVATSDVVASTPAPAPAQEVDLAAEEAPEASGGVDVELEIADLEAVEVDAPAAGDEGDGEGRPPGGDAITESTGGSQGETTDPAAESPAPPPPMPPADAIASIEVTSESDGAVVGIRGNGSLEDGAVSVEPLTSPPRVLVRLRGIVSPYRPYALDSAAPEVSGLRIGHHEDRRPPELWVVIDLADAQAAVRDIDIAGDRVRLVVARP
jgi:uncharacterized protein (TIGR02266 family)